MPVVEAVSGESYQAYVHKAVLYNGRHSEQAESMVAAPGTRRA